MIDFLPDPSPRKKQQLKYDNSYDNSNDYLIEEEDNARFADFLQIGLGEHIGIVARTGAGKTHFVAKGLLPYFEQYHKKTPRYFIDSTADPKIPNMIKNAIWYEGNNPPDLLQDTSKTLVWTPDNSEIPLQYANFMKRLNDSRKPAIVVVDEAASMTKQAESALETLCRQMRKHGGTVIIETQQIAKMSTTYFSQLTHFLLFTINPEIYDMSQARRYLQVPKEEQRQPLYEHGFFYRRLDNKSSVVEYNDVSDFFRSMRG